MKILKQTLVMLVLSITFFSCEKSEFDGGQLDLSKQLTDVNSKRESVEMRFYESEAEFQVALDETIEIMHENILSQNVTQGIKIIKNEDGVYGLGLPTSYTNESLSNLEISICDCPPSPLPFTTFNGMWFVYENGEFGWTYNPNP